MRVIVKKDKLVVEDAAAHRVVIGRRKSQGDITLFHRDPYDDLAVTTLNRIPAEDWDTIEIVEPDHTAITLPG